MRNRNSAAAEPLDGDSRPVGRVSIGAPQGPGLARIGKYDVKSEIGNGARIKVFSAVDPLTGRPVTLKLLMDVTDAASIERFRREVALAANIASSEFAGIYELGEHVGFTFAAMQRVGDDDMRRALKRVRFLSLLQKVSMMWEVAAGAYAAHLAGFASVGIRPSAIALSDREHALIHDFGIVRLSPEDPAETAAYAAPEELDGSPADHLADIFAFGTIYFQLLTGTHPFLSAGSGKPDLRNQPPLREVVPDCPEALERLVLRALERQRALRYQSFEEVQEDAEPILRELRHHRSAAVLDEARSFVEAGEFDRAQGAVREALDLDPDNRSADRLRAEIRVLLKRQGERPRAEALLKTAEQAASAGDYDQAIQILDSAQELDVADPELTDRVESLRRGIARSREAVRLAAEARELMAQGRSAEARAAASQAHAADPQCPATAGLLYEIDRDARRREQEGKVEQGLVQAKALLLLQSFEAAIAGLRALRAECPGFPIVDQWIERVASQKAAAESKAHIDARLHEIRVLLAGRQFDEAIRLLDLLGLQFPQAEIADLAIQAREAKLRDAAVSQALDEAGWLLQEQDRPDLAVQFMREKAAELSADTRFAARLEELEAALPQWEKRRAIEECLRQVAALEQLQQWNVALTVLEEALSADSASGELLAATERVRGRLLEQDNRRRLARRLEAISRRVAAGNWSQALGLIEAARADFPREPELESLEHTTRAAVARARCESIVSEVRQCVADGDLDTAGQMLRSALEATPGEAALTALLAEVETESRDRGEWRMAQVLFGRRQFEEAEAMLVRLAAGNRPEVQALLELVRERRAATEEAEFYKRGIDKASKLIQETQFDQAGDLLKNLLSLFPGDPILQRHLGIAQRAQQGPHTDGAAPVSALVAEGEPDEPAAAPECKPAVLPLPAPEFTIAKRRFRPSTAVALSGLLCVPIAGILWNHSRGDTPAKASAPAKPPARVSPPQVQASPASEGAESVPVPPIRPAALKAPGIEPPKTAAAPLRNFTLPAPRASERSAEFAPPPNPPSGGARPETGSFPSELLQGSRPIPLPQETRQAAAAPPPEAKAATSDLRPATPISRRPPETPIFARQHGISGAVELEAAIDKKGAVTDVKLLNGNPVLGDAAKRAVLTWRYAPATLNGQPVESRLAVRVVFVPGR